MFIVAWEHGHRPRPFNAVTSHLLPAPAVAVRYADRLQRAAQGYDIMPLSMIRLPLLALAAIAAMAGFAHAHEYQIGAIKIGHPWMRQPPTAAKVAGGFMTLTNTGVEADRLIGGTMAAAGRFEVHEMTVVDGVMRMRELRPGLDIKPGETVALKPGSYHVMFMDLKGPLELGAKIKGTLVFEKAGTIEVEFKVEAPGTKGADHEHGAAGDKSGKGSGSGSGSGAAKNVR
jgi:periplasmic copper chaperone A